MTDKGMVPLRDERIFLLKGFIIRGILISEVPIAFSRVIGPPNCKCSETSRMSGMTAKRVVWILGILHLLCAAVLIVLATYLVLSAKVRDGWVALPVLIPASLYVFWLGYRASRTPSPRVVRQICVMPVFLVTVSFVVLVESMEWSHESVWVLLPSAVLVFGGCWLVTFGGRRLCRQLFPEENRA